MSPSVVIIGLTLVVAVHSGFIRPPLIHPGPLLPLPFFGPRLVPIIHPLPPPIFPIFPRIQQKSVFRSRQVARPRPSPRSVPFVMERPEMFRRDEQPVFINIVDSRDPVRKYVIYDDNGRPDTNVVGRPRYLGNTDTGDISIDGNVYISDPYSTTSLNRGATVEQIISSAVGSGQLSSRDRMNEFDYPLPAGNIQRASNIAQTAGVVV